MKYGILCTSYVKNWVLIFLHLSVLESSQCVTSTGQDNLDGLERNVAFSQDRLMFSSSPDVASSGQGDDGEMGKCDKCG